ncbi:hypothetical protein D9C73_026788 [Collichthys lucidus]|uniref:Uncharacterized protein n=1 Tax=Collichthys lucidus TaxID=240159 RepID=A0A4U5W012_COLLU|nr:hypothetical protein D9C73_026788 [Collichthys lucidus]
MPFCKRTVLPKDVWRRRRRLQDKPAEVFGDLADVCGFSLCSVLRQLSDLSRHSVSILEELEGELASVCHRSGALEGRVVRLQRHVAELLSKPPPRRHFFLGGCQIYRVLLKAAPVWAGTVVHLSPLSHLTQVDAHMEV